MSDVLNPIERVKLKINGQPAEIEVREMSWPDAMDFLEKLGAHFQKMVGEDGKIAIDQKELGPLIMGTRALAEFLVLRSTGRDSAWLNERSPREVLRILETAIPLNLNNEVIDLGKRVAGSVQAALGVAPAISGGSSTPSSAKVTPSPKSAR